MIYLIDLKEVWFMISKRTDKSSFKTLGMHKLNELLKKQILNEDEQQQRRKTILWLDIFRTEKLQN